MDRLFYYILSSYSISFRSICGLEIAVRVVGRIFNDYMMKALFTMNIQTSLYIIIKYTLISPTR